MAEDARASLSTITWPTAGPVILADHQVQAAADIGDFQGLRWGVDDQQRSKRVLRSLEYAQMSLRCDG